MNWLITLGNSVKENKLKALELALLGLMVLALPSLEAPKNIFLVFYVVVALFRQISNKSTSWEFWDWLFLAILMSGLLSAIFAGFPHGDQWKGFRGMVAVVSVGWLLSRSTFSSKELFWLFTILVLSTIPPLVWGFFQYYVLHTKRALELHSVGAVNGSAIYLTMIFGATLGACLSIWSSTNKLGRTVLISLTILFYISLFIGRSRGAFGISFLLAAILILCLIKHYKWKLLGLSILVAPALLAFVLNAGVVEKQKINEKNNNVLSNRVEIWNVSLEASRLYPLFGIGLGNWKLITSKDIQNSVEKRHKIYNPNDYYFSERPPHFSHSHNVYITALLERGVIGFCVLIGFMWMWVTQLARSFPLTLNSAQAGYLWAGSLSAWFAIFGIGMTDTTFFHENGTLACFLLGLHIAYCRSNYAML